MFTKKSFKLVIIFSILLLIFPRMDAVAGGLDIDTKDLDIEIENPTPDLVAPIVTDVQVTNEKLTPSTPVKVIADLSDGDDGSGVKSANITYKKPSGATKTFNFIINPSTNKYEATITAEQKDEEGEWIVNNIFVVDKKDNERRVYHSTTVNSDDTFDYSQINLDVSEVLKQTDFEVPILTDMTLQSDTVEAGEKIQLSVVATDNESGVNTATAYYKKPSGKMATINLNRQSNTDTDTFFGSHIVKPYDEPGHWTLTSIELVDKAGNRKAYTSYTSVDGINRTLEHGNVMISGTTLDVEKPVIQNIFVQSNNVANRESIKLTVEATDNFSGIASIRATYKKPSGSTLPIYLYQQAGTDTFSGTSTIGQYDDLGTYELISVIVEDFAGNSMTYNRDSQISNGTVTLKQSDVIISGTTPDHEAPTLKYMKREVSQISANYAEVKYTVEPMDMISGVSSISGRYARPSGKMFDLLFYKVGNAYEAKIIIDKYDEHGIWKLSSISLRDNRGNSKTAYYMNSTGDFENYYFRVKEKVTVSPGVPNAIESIEKLDLQSGDTYQLKPNLRYTDGTKRDITADAITQYTSSNPAAVTISKTGLIKVNDKAKSSKVNIAVTYGEITQSIWITINGGSNDIQLEAKPLKTNLSSGQQQQINVIEVNAGGRKDITSSSSGISYTSSNPTLVTVSKDGLVTVNSENITGVAVIKVSYEGLETEVTIQVTKPTVQSLAISPNEENLSLSDNSLQLIVKAFMSNGSTKDVTKSSSGTTYTSSNKLIAQVDSEGLVSIPSDAKSGKVTITATNSGKSVEMLLNVTGLPEATSIHFKESKIDMKPGETTGYELIAILSDGSEKEVTSSGTYTRSNTYLTIDSATQQVKMSSSAKDGQVITLTGKYEGLTATAEITVKDGSVKPTSIYFKETKLDMKPGETAGYELIAILSDGSEEVVTSSGTFTRSNTYLTIDRAAQQMKMSSSAKKGQVITLTGKYEGLTATAEITVTDSVAKPTSIYFKETKLDMKPGEAIGYQLMALMSDGSEKEVTSSGTYTRSNTYLTIDSATQQVKMSSSAKDGQVITLTGKYEGLTATAEITVTDSVAKPTSIYFKETKLDMKPGEAIGYQLMALMSDGSEKEVTSSGTYTRSNTYLTIDSATQQVKMSSSAKDGQVITLTGKYEGLTATAEITVKDGSVKPTSIYFKETKLDMKPGETIGYQLIALMGDGSEEEVTSSGTYTRSNTYLAIDSATQQVKMSSSAKDGQVITLTGKYEGLTATAEITVKDGSAKPTNIYFKETKLDMKPGEAIGYQLMALMSDGSEEEVTSSGTYTRSNSYLTIDSATQQVKMSGSAKDGQVITLTGKYEGLTATAEITVKDGSVKPTSIYFKETKLDMKPGETAVYELIAILSDGSEEVVTSSGTYTRSNTYLTIDRAARQMKMSSSAKDGQVITLTGKYEGLAASAEITVIQ